MYESRKTPGTVRDRRAWYGGDAQDAETVAACVLEDLPRARDGAHVARILARFALVRFWLLRCDGARPVLLDHARDAATTHLDAVDPMWAEGERLRRLLARQEPLHVATGLLSSAAADAEAAGDVHGAFGLRRAGYRAAVLRLDGARAAELAREIERFVRRRGARSAAAAWADRRRRAEAAASLLGPPSSS